MTVLCGVQRSCIGSRQARLAREDETGEDNLPYLCLLWYTEYLEVDMYLGSASQVPSSPVCL